MSKNNTDDLWIDYAWRSPVGALISACADKLAIPGSRWTRTRVLKYLQVLRFCGNNVTIDRGRFSWFSRVRDHDCIPTGYMPLIDAECRYAYPMRQLAQEHPALLHKCVHYSKVLGEGMLLCKVAYLPASVRAREEYATTETLRACALYDMSTSVVISTLRDALVPQVSLYCYDGIHRFVFPRAEAEEIIRSCVPGHHAPSGKGRTYGSSPKYDMADAYSTDGPQLDTSLFRSTVPADEFIRDFTHRHH